MTENPVFAMLGKKQGKIEKKETQEKITGNTRVTGNISEVSKYKLSVEAQLEGDYNLTDDKELNSYLRKRAIEILSIQSTASLDLGEVFEEVNIKLGGDNHHNGTYVRWLELNGYNRMTALRHRRRYKMFSLMKTKIGKSFVALMPVRLIDSVNKSDDYEGILLAIDDGASREELESMMMNPIVFEGADILPYNPQNTEKVYKNISQILRSVHLEKVSDENIDSFEKDMKRVEKILSRWTDKE